MSSFKHWYFGSYYNDEFNMIYEAMCFWASDYYAPDEYDMLDIVIGKEKVKL